MEKNVLPGNLFPLLDATSLLWRLQVRMMLVCQSVPSVSGLYLMQVRGVDPGEGRWQKVVDACATQIGKPTLVW